MYIYTYTYSIDSSRVDASPAGEEMATSRGPGGAW